MASSRDWKLNNTSRSLRLSHAHLFSMGFRSGEYGGRNKTVQPYFSVSSCNTAFLWNVALSRMITEPSLTSFNRQCSSQYSNKTLSVVPLYWSGAIHSPWHMPATIFVRLYFRPLIFTVTFFPRGALAYSR